MTPAERKYNGVVPSIAPAIRGREFSLQTYEEYTDYLKANPDALKTIGLAPGLAGRLLNYVNGKRSVLRIRNCVIGETGQDVTLDAVAGYLDLLKNVGWITYSGMQ
jgi:hypothetical protein